MGTSFEDLEYLDEDEIRAEFVPSGSVKEFVPGWGDNVSQIPGEKTETGIHIGVVRVWGEDRRVDRSIRFVDVSLTDYNAVDGELEEKFDFFFEGEKFHTREWSPSGASWYNCAVQLPEGFRHTLHSYIDLLVTNWSYDDINEIWWEAYQEEF
ncbi:hypothetical protein [Halobellus ordinarius]|uniref:hypothetical protein n=1 Tax=Halobellus ordinarius TaxID=3075120 RepID=UPI002880B7C2|nr:hypothetical protein [Halobellus sp. ZY16]